MRITFFILCRLLIFLFLVDMNLLLLVPILHNKIGLKKHVQLFINSSIPYIQRLRSIE